MSNLTLNYYKENNSELSSQYNSVDSEIVHQHWLNYLPEKGSLIMDVGAGSGRDAFWLAKQGYVVKAVEPVKEFIDEFNKNNPIIAFEWIVDALPCLATLEKYKNQFDLILLSAVWMHLTEEQRDESFQTFANLNKSNGLLVMSLRYGDSPDQRVMSPVSMYEIEMLSKKYQYKVVEVKQSDDQLRRANVIWKTVILKKIR